MNAAQSQPQRGAPAPTGTPPACAQGNDFAALRGRAAFALQVLDALQALWQTLRTLVGDDAYERYCTHHRLNHPDQPLLDRRAFYIKNQTEKWSGIKRCC